MWRNFRDWFLARHPLCEDCLAEGKIEPAEEVHHLKKVADHPELRLVEANCRGLCKPHHSRRTAAGE